MLTESIAASRMQSLLTQVFPKHGYYLKFFLINTNNVLINMARPERFELPTTWFVVSSTIANVLFFNIDYWNARCPFCTTMQDNA
jgi:hypothetical protein